MNRYLPMLAKHADGPFDGDGWLFEVKWDGIRAIAYVDGALSVRSRNGQELAGQFPELDELRTLAPGTVLDGEIVAMREGRPDIQSLLPRLQSRGGVPAAPVPVTYIIFDILEKDGELLLNLPLVRRKEILLSAVREGPHVVLSVPVDGRGRDYYQAAVAQGLEGVMAKRKDGRYEPGVRSAGWLKITAQKTCDCIIAGYTPGRGGRKAAFGALVLALYDDRSGGAATAGPGTRDVPVPAAPAPDSHPGGQLVYIGKVGTGFRNGDLADLMNLFSRYATKVPQLTDTGSVGKVIWLEPVLVCSVAYQQVTDDRKLRIPRFVRIRSDKRPDECTVSQLLEQKAGRDRTVRAMKPSFAGNDAVLPENGKRGKSYRKEKPPQEMENGKEPARPTQTYREKRNFSTTSEPRGRGAMAGNSFVVHEHRSHKLHYDLRLERDGVLKSWAVPKGIPTTVGEKHLAVAVEDHPLGYATFTGTIPKGEYGAGTVTIWDSGTYETEHWDDAKIEIAMHGRQLNGRYVLVRFKRAGKNDWLVFRAQD